MIFQVHDPGKTAFLQCPVLLGPQDESRHEACQDRGLSITRALENIVRDR